MGKSVVPGAICDFVHPTEGKCTRVAELACNLGFCAPLTNYCTEHYIKTHDMDEADSPDVAPFRDGKIREQEKRLAEAKHARREA